MKECSCREYPDLSECGQWKGNESACVCVDSGLIEQIGQGLPS